MKTEAIVCNFFGKKGAGSLFSYEMVKGLINNGKNVIAIIPDNIENLGNWKQLHNCKLIILGGYTSRIGFLLVLLRVFFIDRFHIKKECSKFKISCVYVPMIQPLTSLINTCFSNVQIITTVHDPIPHKGAGKIITYLYRKATEKSDKLIVLSEMFREFTANEYGHSINDVFVIPHGIFDNYQKAYNKTNRFVYDKSKTNFLFFGRITPYKGLDVLAKAFEKLSKEHENISLTIVGNGNFKPYESFYSHQKNVTLINRWIKDEEVYGFYDGAKVITVLPYTEATQSGVIPLAMASDSLVICSNCGGLSEQVQHNQTGILVMPDDVDGLYQAMKNVVVNGVNENIIEKAKSHIQEYSWNRLSQRLIEIM